MSRSHRPRQARTALVAAVLGLALALALASSAYAGSGEQIVQDCLQNGYVNPNGYSRGDLERAREGLPSDVSEYTDCYDVISTAIDAKRGRARGGGRGPAPGTGASGGSRGGDVYHRGVANAGELAAVGKANNEVETTLKRPRPKVDLRGDRAASGTLAGLEPAAAANDLPLSILLSLIAVGVVLAAGALVALLKKLSQLRRRA